MVSDINKYDDSDNTCKYYGEVRDKSVHELKEELSNAKNFIECIFDTTNAMIAYLDVDFNFIRVNKRYAEAGNYPPEFYIGKNHFELYPDSDNIYIFQHVVNTGQTASYKAKPFVYAEFPERGVTYWDWDLIPTKGSHGEVNGLICSLIDVTKRKKAEDELLEINAMLERKVSERTIELQTEVAERIKTEEALKFAKEEADRANNAKSEYIANLSHELRTPLNVILSAIQLLDLYIRSNPSAITDKHFHHLKTIKQNSLRLLRLVNNLIDTTKIDSDYFELNLGKYDIVNIIKTITLSVIDYVQNKKISLNFSSNVYKKAIVCDIDIIERIMLNLLSNAIKFTDKDGIIDVIFTDKGKNIYISVKDNGVGIPYDKQTIIFERYKQADQLLTRKHEGSGIGLSLTKSFVEALGGTIIVKSKPGTGSEFIVELPCNLVAGKIHQKDFDYALNNNNIIQKITVELSDIYSI